MLYNSTSPSKNFKIWPSKVHKDSIPKMIERLGAYWPSFLLNWKFPAENFEVYQEETWDQFTLAVINEKENESYASSEAFHYHQKEKASEHDWEEYVIKHEVYEEDFKNPFHSNLNHEEDFNSQFAEQTFKPT